MYSYNLLNNNMLLVVLLYIIKTYRNSSFRRKFITFFLLTRINGSFLFHFVCIFKIIFIHLQTNTTICWQISILKHIYVYVLLYIEVEK